MVPLPGSLPDIRHAELIERLALGDWLADCRVLTPPQAETWWTARDIRAALTGRLVIAGHDIWLRVGLPGRFPLRLPEIAVESVEPFIELPHVFAEGKLCYEPEANLLLDRHAPWDVLVESLALARQVLQELLTGDRAKEFALEAGAYWVGLAQGRLATCDVTPGEQPRVLTAWSQNGEPFAVADANETAESFQPAQFIPGSKRHPALYLPLDPVAIDPDFSPARLMTLDGLRRYVRALPDGDRQLLSKLLKGRAREVDFIVIGLQRPDAERVLLGAHLVELHGGHLLTNDHARGRVAPVSLQRFDHAYLAPRGGAGIDLQTCRVLLAGCGAVGGHLALALARAGVGNLTLIDPDIFDLANTYRHVCGATPAGTPKVLGLKNELRRHIPRLSVKTHFKDLENLLHQHPGMLREHDLVIAATGNPTTELQLNEWVRLDDRHPPVVFTWVEPHGLGGHALLCHTRCALGLTRGCLECIYHRPVEGGPIENQAAFATPGVVYTRDILGCGSRYLPFADLDAQRTAELAARLSLSALRQEAGDSPLLSWKGESRAFEKAGYHVTPRFTLRQEQLDALRLQYIRPDCPVCRG